MLFLEFCRNNQNLKETLICSSKARRPLVKYERFRVPTYIPINLPHLYRIFPQKNVFNISPRKNIYFHPSEKVFFIFLDKYCYCRCYNIAFHDNIPEYCTSDHSNNLGKSTYWWVQSLIKYLSCLEMVSKLK